MEQMRKGNDLPRGLRRERPAWGQLPFHTSRDPGHIPEQGEEHLVQCQPPGTLPGPRHREDWGSITECLGFRRTQDTTGSVPKPCSPYRQRGGTQARGGLELGRAAPARTRAAVCTPPEALTILQVTLCDFQDWIRKGDKALSSSLGMFTLGTQLPWYEETQATPRPSRADAPAIHPRCGPSCSPS